MPVTIQVAKHPAESVQDGLLTGRAAGHGWTSHDVLTRLAHKNAHDIGPILTTGLGPQTSLTDAKLRDMAFSVRDHGLVRAAFHAYSSHHHLVLRPEDVWFAILTQFSFFVNAHAEDLRSSFVAHEGKKGLILRDPGQPDMGLVCRNMTKLIDANIVDPALRRWILPSFSTTTLDDGVVAAVIMMGTLQKYFDYVFDMEACGIPSVTLLGEQSDWEDIERRIEKLTEYGAEPTQFCGLLRPVLRNIVATFASPPGDAAVVDFWSRIVNRMQGSGMDTLTGWLIAFCFWDEDGKCLHKHGFPSVDYKSVPAGFVSAPVTYISPEGEVIETKLLAGFVGFEATAADIAEEAKAGSLSVKSESTSEAKDSAGGADPGEQNVLDTLRPLTGWWMYEIKATGYEIRSGRSYLQDKLISDWNGQASTGYVQDDGETVIVEEGLPRY